MPTVTGYALEHAVASGACRRCSTAQALVCHDESLCPRWAHAVERERLVTCRAIGCSRQTLRNDGLCSEVCAARVRRVS